MSEENQCLPSESLAGMTLRDYFAAKYIGGCAADPSIVWSQNSIRDRADEAYKVADAMLEAERALGARQMNLDQLRKDFEAWFEADCMPLESDWFKRDPEFPEDYEHLPTHWSWRAWVAAIAKERGIYFEHD